MLFKSLVRRSSQQQPFVAAPSDPVSHRFKTCVYYSNWSIYGRNHWPKDVPAGYVTNLFYAFFNINSATGEVCSSDEYADYEIQVNDGDRVLTGLLANLFELKKKHRHLKVSMSIGGWSNNENFSQGVSNPDKLHRFVESSLALLVRYGFDGIDLDWEYPSSKTEAATYLELIKLLKQGLTTIEIENNLPKASFLLTIASPAFEEKLQLLNITEMDKYLSFWNLMTYDFAGGWSTKADYHCNLFKTRKDGQLCANDCIEYFLKLNINPSKLILGMANYGRSFTNTKGYNEEFHGVGAGSADEEGIWNYNCLPLPNTIEKFDSKAVVAYNYDPVKKMFISYDNVDSVKAKAEYVRDKKLGGGMWWESCGDCYDVPEKSLLIQFVNQLGGVKSLQQNVNQTDLYNN